MDADASAESLPSGAGGAPATVSAPLVVWLDASRLSLVPGVSVARWTDAGPGQHDFLQSELALQPTMAAISAAPVVHFGTKRSLWLADTPSARPTFLTLFVVCRSSTAGAPIVGMPYGLDLASLPYPYWNWTLFHDGDGRAEVRVDDESLVGPVSQDWHWEDLGVFAYRSSRREVQRNGAPVFAIVTTEPPHPISYDPLPPAMTIGTLLGDFEGDVAELLIYDGTLSDGEVASINTYLEGKWLIR